MNVKRVKVIAFLMLVLCVFFVGAATPKELLKASKVDVKAKSYGSALDKIFTAYQMEPENRKVQSAIFKSAAKYIVSAESFLASSEAALVEKVDCAVLEKRYDELTALANVYSILSELDLPIQDSRKKKSFSTELKDYTEAVEEARTAAYDAFTKKGLEFIKLRDAENAYTYYKKVLDKFAIQDEVVLDVVKAGFSTDFVTGSEACNNDTDIAELEKGLALVEKALEFGEDNEAAKIQLVTIKNKIADQYVIAANAIVEKGNVKKMPNAIPLYDKALEVSPEYPSAVEGKNNCLNIIADYYYQLGVKFASKLKSKYAQKAVDNFKESQKWVENYKDSQVWIKRLEVLESYHLVVAALNDANKVYDKVKKETASTGRDSKKVVSSIDDLMGVSNDILKLGAEVKETSNTLDEISEVEVVKPKTAIVQVGLGSSSDSLESFAATYNGAKDGVVMESFGRIKAFSKYNSELSSKFKDIKNLYNDIDKSLDKVSEWVLQCSDEEKLVQIEKVFKDAKKELNVSERIMETINSSLKIIDQVSEEAKNASSLESRVNRSLSKFKSVYGDFSKNVIELETYLSSNIVDEDNNFEEQVQIILEKRDDYDPKYYEQALAGANEKIDVLDTEFPVLDGVEDSAVFLTVKLNRMSKTLLKSEDSIKSNLKDSANFISSLNKLKVEFDKIMKEEKE